MSENKEISEETKTAINEAANWLSQWLTERYNQGLLTKEEYTKSIDKLKNTKVFTTSKGYDRIVEALEKKDISLTSEAKRSAISGYERIPVAHGMSKEDVEMLAGFGQIMRPANEKLSSDEKAVAYMKIMFSKTTASDNNLGFHGGFIKEPAVFLNIDRINECADNERAPTLTSVAVHELTHNLQLEHQEDLINEALHGNNITSSTGHTPPQEPAVAPVISVQIISDTDTPPLKHSRSKDDEKEKIDPNIVLKDGVEGDSYLDSSNEVYARLMQLRYDFKLKPDENFTEEQIAEIEKRAKEAKEKFSSGENSEKADIDFNIISRYRENTLQQMLNEIAGNEIFDARDARNALKVQRKLTDNALAALETSKQERDTKTNTNTTEQNIGYSPRPIDMSRA